MLRRKYPQLFLVATRVAAETRVMRIGRRPYEMVIEDFRNRRRASWGSRTLLPRHVLTASVRCDNQCSLRIARGYMREVIEASIFYRLVYACCRILDTALRIVHIFRNRHLDPR